MKRIKNNIDNLTSVWATVSQPFNGYASDGSISYAQVKKSEWPNRIWTNQILTTKLLTNIKELVETSQCNMRFVDFEYEEKTDPKNLIKNNGFKLASSLPGMSLKLTKPFDVKTKLRFSLVTNVNEAKIWCDIFKQSFGYVISIDLVVKNMHKVNFYIAFNNNIPVGTVKLYQTNKIAGIYSLGVPSNMRGNGYAKEIMYFILDKSKQQGATLATLQASKLAEGMYEKLGFQKDFIMKSYKLKTQ